MDVREKLVELLQVDLSGSDGYEPELIADYMLNHGVTVQGDKDINVPTKWISVKDKLPPYNRDVLVYRPNMAMKILVDDYAGYYGEDDNEWYEGWTKYGTDTHGNPVITHWAYLPQPPKGDVHNE